jgi:hypothetical protein
MAGADHLPVTDLDQLARTRPGETTNTLVKAHTRAPLRNRTVDLLLTIYLYVHAVANCGDAGQVRGSALCCSPTYLFIALHPAAVIGAQLVTLRKRRRRPPAKGSRPAPGRASQWRMAHQSSWQQRTSRAW